MLRTVRTVIVDEIHAVIGTPARRAPRAVARAAAAGRRARRSLRIGLSATQKPIDEVARFLVGDARSARCAIVDEGHRRGDGSRASRCRGSPLEAVMSHEVWEEYYDRLAALIARIARRWCSSTRGGWRNASRVT